MAFWTEGFMQKMRTEWLRRIAKIQYYADGIWYDAEMTEKQIVGNTLRIKSMTTDELTLLITKVRLLDTAGDTAGEIEENITKLSSQGILTLWEFPLYEIPA